MIIILLIIIAFLLWKISNKGNSPKDNKVFSYPYARHTPVRDYITARLKLAFENLNILDGYYSFYVQALLGFAHTPYETTFSNSVNIRYKEAMENDMLFLYVLPYYHSLMYAYGFIHNFMKLEHTMLTVSSKEFLNDYCNATGSDKKAVEEYLDAKYREYSDVLNNNCDSDLVTIEELESLFANKLTSDIMNLYLNVNDKNFELHLRAYISIFNAQHMPKAYKLTHEFYQTVVLKKYKSEHNFQ